MQSLQSEIPADSGAADAMRELLQVPRELPSEYHRSYLTDLRRRALMESKPGLLT